MALQARSPGARQPPPAAAAAHASPYAGISFQQGPATTPPAPALAPPLFQTASDASAAIGAAAAAGEEGSGELAAAPAVEFARQAAASPEVVAASEPVPGTPAEASQDAAQDADHCRVCCKEAGKKVIMLSCCCCLRAAVGNAPDELTDLRHPLSFHATSHHCRDGSAG